ncbi:MAG: hypothetical protein CM1200mP10_27570 [Candidatus Neomarinimicrobiota bacterium]|nr:MAG: hypothetical protein CM1200mP10_27570 [Candidatus Neomarinimicrobiota bacterium]
MASYIGYSSFRQTYQAGDALMDLTIVLDQGNLFGQEVTVMARKKEETIKDVPYRWWPCVRRRLRIWALHR